MTGRKMLYFVAVIIVCVVAYFGWKLTARGSYESAAYSVLESEGSFELREYPDLMLATTAMNVASQGNDGSFGRLFGYISGQNEGNQKVSMTTPVFMEPESGGKGGQMGFVLPEEVARQAVPQPTSEEVRIRTREGGRFAVLRFAGRLNDDTQAQAENQLRAWMDGKGLDGINNAEFAGYDPPWTPGPLRRNEVLIRLN